MTREQPDAIYAVGDIHGCVNELVALLDALPLTPRSQIVFLGDYIDRGPHSAQVIDLLIQLRKSVNIITLMGNHESMFLDFLQDQKSTAAAQFIFNGGGATLASYGDGKGAYEIPDSHLRFLQNLLPYYETEDFFCVHAGVPDVPLDKINLRKHGSYILWARDGFLDSAYPWGKTIVHGHTPSRSPEVTASRINVDTGCVFGNNLTAVRLGDRKFFHVPRQSEIEKPKALMAADSRRRSVRFKGSIPIQVHFNEAGIILETIDYNEFGFYGFDASRGRGVELEEDQVVDVQFQTSPGVTSRRKAKVVRVEKERRRILYAVRFVDAADKGPAKAS